MIQFDVHIFSDRVGSTTNQKINFQQQQNGYFRKWWYPSIIHFNRVFHYKPSILGYFYFRKHPNLQSFFFLGFERTSPSMAYRPVARQVDQWAQRVEGTSERKDTTVFGREMFMENYIETEVVIAKLSCFVRNELVLDE